MTMRPATSLIAAALIAIGLVGAGWFAAQGMAKLRTDDRYVTVKGSAERIVDADLVVWPMPHFVGGNDLRAVTTQLDANTATIRAFFADAGFGEGEIAVSPPRLEDRWTYAYGENRPPERYRYATTVTLRTTRVDDALRRSAAVANSSAAVCSSNRAATRSSTTPASTTSSPRSSPRRRPMRGSRRCSSHRTPAPRWAASATPTRAW